MNSLTDSEVGVSPLVGAILMVAVTVLLSAIIGGVVMNMQPSDPGDTQSSVRIEAESEGVRVTPITIGSTVEVRYEGVTLRTFNSSHVGESMFVPAAKDERLTVVTEKDGKTKVINSGQARANPSLQSYYPLDTLSNGTTPDESATVNPATAKNGASLTSAGKIGSAFTFDAAQQQYVLAETNNFSVEGWEDLTISAWVNTDGYVNATENRNEIVMHDYAGFRIAMDDNYHPFFGVRNNTKSWSLLTASSTTLQSGRWYHFVAVYDDQTMTIYINGTKVAEKTGVKNYTFDSNSEPLTIGVHSHENKNYWNGRIDDVRIFRRAVDNQSVQMLYRYGKNAK